MKMKMKMKNLEKMMWQEVVREEKQKRFRVLVGVSMII